VSRCRLNTPYNLEKGHHKYLKKVIWQIQLWNTVIINNWKAIRRERFNDSFFIIIIFLNSLVKLKHSPSLGRYSSDELTSNESCFSGINKEHLPLPWIQSTRHNPSKTENWGMGKIFWRKKNFTETVISGGKKIQG